MKMPEIDDPQSLPLILLVDDSPTSLRVLQEALCGDYTTVVEESGEAALARLGKAPLPDLILLDLMMPGMDGFEALKRLKENEATRSVPVIVMTATDDEESEAMALERGAVDFIRKPFRLPVALARVRSHVALKRAREAVERHNQELCSIAALRDDIELMTRQDLKTPLSVIVRESQALMDDPHLAPERRERIFALQAAGYSVINMLNLSLDLYRMETDAYVLDWQSVDLAPLIDRVFQEYQALTEEKRIHYSLIAPDAVRGLPPSFEVPGDGLLLYTAFSKMIKFAIEISPVGETVTIELDKVSPSGYVVRICTKGTVPSIESGLFQKNAVCGPGADTGLEGYAARLIVETHGGEISLDSCQESQTVIRIVLPRRSGDTAA
jgi:CheY-like chemotaxis protein